jgi:hypothetical protein
MAKSMELKDLLSQLPDVLQNKIFYYATLHPVAIAFNKDFHDNYLKEVRIYHDFQKRCNTFYCSEDYDKYENYVLCNYDMSACEFLYDYIIRFLSIEDILENKRDSIIKRYKRHNRLCDKCWWFRREEEYTNPIFNSVDKFCLKCVKQINVYHDQILRLDQNK